MKILLLFNLLIIPLFTSFSAFAIKFYGSNDYKILKIINKEKSTEIYIPNYKQKYYLLYKSNYPYQYRDSISTDNIDSDIIVVGFFCGKNTLDLNFCMRFFNRSTSQMSMIVPHIIDSNDQKKIVAYQVKNKDLIVVTPIFQKCQNPLTYKIKIYPDTDFGVKSKFLKNGDLQLEYVDLNNHSVLKKIPINYKNLYKSCGLKQSLNQ
ncbi:MAG: hypothetical protein JSR33_03325 [Proteobacteria bacterium]|nr:hypothetical protein [Pseudomonadota bacterium]